VKLFYSKLFIAITYWYVFTKFWSSIIPRFDEYKNFFVFFFFYIDWAMIEPHPFSKLS